MVTTSSHQEPAAHSLRSWATAVLWLLAATLCSALLDADVSLTSQAMLYVLVIACLGAVAAVTSLET